MPTFSANAVDAIAGYGGECVSLRPRVSNGFDLAAYFEWLGKLESPAQTAKGSGRASVQFAAILGPRRLGSWPKRISRSGKGRFGCITRSALHVGGF